ncbi:hypothetical protein PV433_03390 [Paenibacillus sp. GYB004]|uniref:hypothetical protein n=1 Tax=Paenibacillus sp. GYB004 TaxID=2994393 RepID=UPI002F964D50
MILYRLAKWMEERKRLKRLIAETDGDSAVYIKQKADVERLMIREAHRWLEPGKAAGGPVLTVREQEESYTLMLAQMPVQERIAPLPEVLAEVRRSSLETAAHPGRGNTGPVRAEELVPEELLHMPLVGEDTMQPQL